MKKVTFVRRQDTLFGGAENYLRRLIGELKNRNVEIEILHLNQPKWIPSWIKFLFYDSQFCRVKKDSGFYFSNDRLSCIDIYRAGGGVHKIFLKTKGFTLNPLHLIYLYLEKKSFENSKHIISVSNMVKDEIIQSYKISPEKITTIYNGVDIKNVSKESILEAKREILEEFNIKNRNIILYVGSGFKRKGVEEFLEILSKLDRDFIAFVVGKEKKISKYKKLSKKLKIEDKVIFTGARKDVDKFYKSSDIFLFPSRYEPFGNVVLEAMSFYNAVITTKQCGSNDILKFEPVMESPKDFKVVEFIRELLDDKKKLEEIKLGNRKIVENYSIQRNVDKTIELIKRVQSENFSN